jgi:hypothetical protein
MRREPLSLKPFVLVVSLPALFFLAAGAAVIFTSSYLLVNPTTLTKVLGAAVNYSIFGTQPPSEIKLGESFVPKEARTPMLKRFLASYNSPLAPYAEYMIKISDKYGLDWRLLPAIAGNESLFGRVVPYNSYNAWGWGVHSRGTLGFASWEEGIEKVAVGLKQNYLDQGLTTVDQIMQKYAPVSVANAYPWSDNIKFFMERLEQGKGYREE